MKNYGKNTTSSYLTYLDANSLHGWAMYQKLPVNGFEWVEDVSQFKEDFIKSYDENSDKGYFLDRKKIVNCNKLVCDFHYKETMLFT